MTPVVELELGDMMKYRFYLPILFIKTHLVWFSFSLWIYQNVGVLRSNYNHLSSILFSVVKWNFNFQNMTFTQLLQAQQLYHQNKTFVKVAVRTPLLIVVLFFISGCLYIMWFSRHSCHNFCHNVSAQRATIVCHGAGWGLRRGSNRCLHWVQFDAIYR